MTVFTPIPLGTDIQVNTTTTNAQVSSSVAALPGGGFVVTWTSYLQDGSDYGIYAQRFDASGNKVGTEFLVNTTTANLQYSPTVTPLADGSFVITWSSQNQDGSGRGVYGQLFDSSGVKTGGEFLVNTYTSNNQDDSKIATLANGDFVVTWTSNGQDGSGYGVYGQRFDVSGTKSGAEFRVNTYSSGAQLYSSVAALANGGFLVTWTSDGQDGSEAGVYGQLFDASGTKSGAEFRVNTYSSGAQLYSSVAVLADGGFVVTWSSHGQDGDDYGIYGQRFDASGAAVGGEFLVNTHTTSEQSYPGIASLADGGFLITWRSYSQDGSGYGVYGQRYDATGVTAGAEFRLNSITVGDQQSQSFSVPQWVAQLADGRIVATWSGIGAQEVFARLFDLPANTAPAGTNATITLAEDTSHAFSAADFGFTDVDAGDVLGAVRIDTLPASGTLTLDGAAVHAGQVVAAADVTHLVFTPAADGNGTGYASLTFSVSDGAAFDATPNTLTFDVTAANDAPSATDDPLTAVEGTTVSGHALTNDSDVDGTDVLTIIGVSTVIGGSATTGVVGQQLAGKYGVLTLQSNGSYSYAAQDTALAAGRTATDTFTYTVSDGHGGTDTADIVVTVSGGSAPFGGNAGTILSTIDPNGRIEGVGDFDHNGLADFLWRDDSTHVLELRTARAGGGYDSRTLGTFALTTVFEASADLDGDGTDDVVIRDSTSGVTGAWVMRNGVPSDWRALGTLSSDWTIAGTGDFDRNGTDDILLFDTTTGAVDVWAQGRDGPGARSTVGTLAAGWAVVGIGDFDGNGTDDVLFFNATSRHIGAWQMSPGRPGGWLDYGVLNDGWQVTRIADYDGTGAADIGLYNASTGQDGAWVMRIGNVSDWIAHPSHDDLDPMGAGRLGGSSDQILWHNAATGAVVAF